MSFYICAETAFHHEGDKDYLIKLIDETKKAGVNGVKFQVLIELNEFMSSLHSAYNEAKNWIFTLDEWREIFQYTKELGLDIILMPLDTKAFILANEFEIKYIEIHSVSFRDTNLLSMLDTNTIPLIFGIGGRTIEEISLIVEKYKDKSIILMVGFQAYPSNLEDIKIGRIKELVKMYPNCQIGYADHSSYDNEMAIISNEYAYILGARFFEKHIAFEEGKKRIDFQSAVSADKIKIIKCRIEYLDKLLNIDKKGLFDMTEKEISYRNRQKIPVAKFDLEAAHLLSGDDLELKMIDSNQAIAFEQHLIGHKLKVNIPKNASFVKEAIYD